MIFKSWWQDKIHNATSEHLMYSLWVWVSASFQHPVQYLSPKASGRVTFGHQRGKVWKRWLFEWGSHCLLVMSVYLFKISSLASTDAETGTVSKSNVANTLLVLNITCHVTSKAWLTSVKGKRMMRHWFPTCEHGSQVFAPVLLF